MRSLGRSIHQKLIEPPDHIQGSSLRHRSRLLNIVLIPLIALFLAVDISHHAQLSSALVWICHPVRFLYSESQPGAQVRDLPDPGHVPGRDPYQYSHQAGI